MMPLESAIDLSFGLAANLYERIEKNEARWECMDGKRRSQIGALRALLMHAGVPHDALPETPYLEPAHLEAYRNRQELYRAQKADAEGAA